MIQPRICISHDIEYDTVSYHVIHRVQRERDLCFVVIAGACMLLPFSHAGHAGQNVRVLQLGRAQAQVAALTQAHHHTTIQA